MPKDKPTQEKLKKFWEWCLDKKVELRGGFYGMCGEFLEAQDNPYMHGTDIQAECLCWLDDENEKVKIWQPVPDLNLNNLFKYAVPKAIDRIMVEQDGCSSDVAYAILFKRWLAELQLDMQHPALTLFKVLDQVMEVGK